MRHLWGSRSLGSIIGWTNRNQNIQKVFKNKVVSMICLVPELCTNTRPEAEMNYKKCLSVAYQDGRLKYFTIYVKLVWLTVCYFLRKKAECAHCKGG